MTRMICDLFHLSGDQADLGGERGPAAFQKKRERIFAIRQVKVSRHIENKFQPVEEEIPVLTLHRKTTFFVFLIVICQLAIVDTYYLLPAGLICYAIGIGLAIELLETPDEYLLWHDIVRYKEEIRHQQEMLQRKEFRHQKDIFHEEEVRRVQQIVDFEFRVLQGKDRVPRVVAREENGRFTYYTI